MSSQAAAANTATSALNQTNPAQDRSNRSAASSGRCGTTGRASTVRNRIAPKTEKEAPRCRPRSIARTQSAVSRLIQQYSGGDDELEGAFAPVGIDGND